MYGARGTPGRKHLTSGSRANAFASFSFFFASASGRYGSGPPSTTPRLGATPPQAPMTTTAPGPPSGGCMSDSAPFMAFQSPVKLGLPSGVRGARYAVGAFGFAAAAAGV